MKFCSKCGAQNDDTARFCKECGEALDEATVSSAPQPNAYAQPAFVPPAQNAYVKRLASNDAINALKLAGSSGAYLTMAIASSISILLSVVYILVTVMGMSGLSFYSSAESSVLIVSTVISGIFGLLISVISVYAIWKIYSESRKPGDYFNTVGLSILNVFMWISFALVCVGVFLGLLGSLASGLASNTAAAGIVVFIVMLIFFIPILLYYLFAAKSVSRAKKSAKTGMFCGKASVYVAVINILLAVSSLFSLFAISQLRNTLGVLLYNSDVPGETAALLMTVLGSAGGILSVGTVLTIIIYITSSVVIFKYNSYVKPAYQQPVYTPNVNPYSQGPQQEAPIDSPQN